MTSKRTGTSKRRGGEPDYSQMWPNNLTDEEFCAQTADLDADGLFFPALAEYGRKIEAERDAKENKSTDEG